MAVKLYASIMLLSFFLFLKDGKYLHVHGTLFGDFQNTF